MSWKDPPAQLAQVELLRLGATVPGAQGTCSVEPVEHAEPLGQSVHAPADCSPGAFEYVPARHGSAAAAPAAQKLPAVHVLQSLLPASSWYSPAEHDVQLSCWVCALKVPGAQLVGSAEPTGQKVPLPQTVHWLELDMTIDESVGLCVPPGHGSAAAAPSAQ